MNTARNVNHEQSVAVGDEQFLTFTLAGEEYGIVALKVQEIKGWEKVTPIPNSPAYVRGVLNLRGLIVPIIDLRLRFNLPEIDYTPVTAIVVVNVGGRLAGLVVDSVSDVIDLGAKQRCAAPEFEGQANRQFIQGLAQVDNKLLILIDIDRMIGNEFPATEGGSPAVVDEPVTGGA